MIPLFFGLTAANLLLMVGVFVLGMFTKDMDNAPTFIYPYHITLGVAVGLIAALTHVTVYTYFMATTKWLRAATDKANLDPAFYVEIPMRRKRRALPVSMIAIVATMLCLFAGAGADTTLWPREVHLVTAILAIAVNFACAAAQYILIRDQTRLIHAALDVVNRSML